MILVTFFYNFRMFPISLRDLDKTFDITYRIFGKIFRTRGSRVSSRAPKPGDFSGVRTSRVSLGVPELGVSVPSFFKPISTSRT